MSMEAAIRTFEAGEDSALCYPDKVFPDEWLAAKDST
jgi:hypothetical protein